MIISFLPLNDDVETFFLTTGVVAAMGGLIFLCFLYVMPEKLKMQEEIENDF